MLSHLVQGEPFGRVRDKDFFDEVFGFIWDILPYLILKREFAFLDKVEQLCLVIGVPGKLSAKYDEGHHSNTPTVRFKTVWLTPKDLWRNIS